MTAGGVPFGTKNAIQLETWKSFVALLQCRNGARYTGRDRHRGAFTMPSVGSHACRIERSVDAASHRAGPPTAVGT